MTPPSVLRDRGVRALVTADAISNAGTQMTYIVLPWFVLTTTGSPARTSVVVAAELLPVAIFGLASGKITSRLGARRTFLVCDAARALLLGAIPTLHLLGALSFATLVALVFVVGVFMVPHAAAQRVVIPELVGEDERRVGQGMSLLQTGWAVASVVGPAVGGVLIALIGETNVLYVDAASYAVSFALVLGWVRPERRTSSADERSGVLDGVKFLMRDRLLRVWALSITGINVVWTAMAVVFPVLVLERFGQRPEILGWLFGAFGVGSVVGAVVSYRLLDRVDRLLLASVGAVGQATLMWAFLPEIPWQVLAASAAVAGVFFPIVNACVITVRTMRTPVALRPTVHTAAVTLAVLLAPLGALSAGPALEEYDLATVLLVILLGNTAVCGAIAVAALRERRLTAEEPGPVVDGEHEPAGPAIAAGVARRRD